MRERDGATGVTMVGDREGERLDSPAAIEPPSAEGSDLLAEYARLRRQHAAIAHILAALGSSADLEPVLREIAAAVAEALRADSATVFLYDADGDVTTDAVLHDYPPDWPREANLLLPPSAIPAEREAITTGRPVVSNHPEDYFDPSWPRRRDGTDLRAFIVAPLLREGRVLGCLHVNRYAAARPFTTDDAAFAREVAAQAVVAIERARLFAAEQRRRIEAEAVATVAGAASSLALPEVLEATLRMAAQAIPCDLAMVTLIEPGGQALRIVAAQGLPADRFRGRLLPLDAGYNSAVYRERRPLLIADAQTEDRGYPLDAFTATLNNVVCAPLVARDRALGTLYLARQATASFTAADLRLLETLAGQVALAVDNAQLYAAERARAARAEALREIGRELSAELDLGRFLPIARQQIARIVDHESCWLALWDEAAGELDFRLYIADGQRRPDREIRHARGMGLAWTLIDERRTLNVPDYLDECRRRGLLPTGPAGRATNPWLGVPLLAGGRIIGAMAVQRCAGAFSDEEAATLELLAGQLAAALENAWLYEQAQAQRREETTFSAIAHDLAGSLGSATILRRLADHARALLGTTNATLVLRDPASDLLYTAARSGGVSAAPTLQVLRPGEGLVGRVWEDWRPFSTADYAKDRRFSHTPELDQRARAIRSVGALGVPIALGAERLGVLLVGDERARRFTAHEEGVLGRLATHAALAVRNARQYDEARRRAARAEALREIGRELSAELDLERFLAVAWRQLSRIMGIEDCWLALWDDAAGTLDYRLYVNEGARNPDAEGQRAPGSGLAGVLLTERATICVPDYAAECLRRGRRPAGPRVPLPDNAWLGVPLLTGGRVIGAMAVWRVTAPFSDEDVATLEALAGQIAAALENARLYEEARQLARTDPLTGVANHRHAQERLDEELSRAIHHGHPLAVIMADLDNFKLFNDTYGHPAGDQVLRLVAEALRAEARAADLIGRYGGDEFLLALPEMDTDGALAFVARVRARMQRTHPALDTDNRIPLSLSTGVAVYPHDGAQRHELIALADGALYTSKRGGGRSVVSTGSLAGRVDPLAVATHTGSGVVEGLVLAVDGKDNYTVPHSLVVADIALLLADALGLPDHARSILRTAGLLHDVGKISIPDRILRKPGPLTDEEWQVMRQHVEFSELIIRGVPGLSDILEPVMHHHERWDGQGYPRGLAGEAVPLLGRIMIVADAYSAMTLDRPYRRGLTIEQAVEQLRAGSGVQFDPHLVAILCDRVERDTLRAVCVAS